MLKNKSQCLRQLATPDAIPAPQNENFQSNRFFQPCKKFPLP